MGEAGEIELTPKDTFLLVKGRNIKKTHLIISKDGRRKVISQKWTNFKGQGGARKEIEMRDWCRGISNWEIKQR